MNKYLIKFRFKGHEYLEEVTCYTEHDAKELIKARYSGCIIYWAKKE